MTQLGGPSPSLNGAINGHEQRGLFSQFNAGLYRAAFDPGGREEITRPYEENIFVHSALKVKSTAAASVGLTIWRTEDIEADPLPSQDEFVTLFSRPNPLMSASKFWAAHVINMALDGENFWFMVGDDGEQVEQGKVPSQLWPIRGSRVEPAKRAPNGVPSAWKYTGSDGKPRVFEAHAVVHFSEYDPNDMTRGLGTVQVLGRTMDLMFQSERYQSGVLRNGGDPGGIITYEKRMGARGEKDRVQNEIDDMFSNPENRGRNIVLDSDAKYTPNKLSAKDMEFHTLWKEMRTTILGALGVPPPLVGVYEDSTYNNLLEAKRDLWLGGLGVLTHLTCVERDLAASFWPLFTGPPAGYVARFDVSSVEALSFANLDKLKEARELVRTGAALSWNDAFEMVGLDLTPPRNADVVWLSGALLPVGDIVGGAEGEEVEMSATDEPSGSGESESVEGELTGEPVEDGIEPSASGSSVGFDGSQMQVALELVRDV
ncbi:MAG: phage portal protein, partial [Deltaproteobacteria bacterium]|nr:phage portal protein [Deltaproteobacteria bacterium]